MLAALPNVPGRAGCGGLTRAEVIEPARLPADSDPGVASAGVGRVVTRLARFHVVPDRTHASRAVPFARRRSWFPAAISLLTAASCVSAPFVTR